MKKKQTADNYVSRETLINRQTADDKKSSSRMNSNPPNGAVLDPALLGRLLHGPTGRLEGILLPYRPGETAKRARAKPWYPAV